MSCWQGKHSRHPSRGSGRDSEGPRHCGPGPLNYAPPRAPGRNQRPAGVPAPPSGPPAAWAAPGRAGIAASDPHLFRVCQGRPLVVTLRSVSHARGPLRAALSSRLPIWHGAGRRRMPGCGPGPWTVRCVAGQCRGHRLRAAGRRGPPCNTGTPWPAGRPSTSGRRQCCRAFGAQRAGETSEPDSADCARTRTEAGRVTCKCIERRPTRAEAFSLDGSFTM